MGEKSDNTFWGVVNHVISWAGCLTFFYLCLKHC